MGWVYVLKAHVITDHGQSLIKIGMSNKRDFNDRIQWIQREWMNSGRGGVSILAIEQCQDALSVEQQLHQKFKQYSKTIGEIRQSLCGECSGDSEWFLVPTNAINSRIKPSADRLSDYPDYHDTEGIPWLGIMAVIGIVLFAIGNRTISTTSQAQSVTIINASPHTGANIRSAPNGSIVGYAANNERVAVKGRSGEWVEIGVGKWVWGEYVK
jgi:hypothetical protein